MAENHSNFCRFYDEEKANQQSIFVAPYLTRLDAYLYATAKRRVHQGLYAKACVNKVTSRVEVETKEGRRILINKVSVG